MTLCSEKTGKYLIYRFGTKTYVQLEFPKSKDKLSWQEFEYSYWLRGGGAQNEGMDINYLALTIDKAKYVIYDNYYAVGDKHKTGIKVINLATNKTVNINGNKTQKGTLTTFRFNNRIKKSESLYD